MLQKYTEHKRPPLLQLHANKVDDLEEMDKSLRT